LSGNHNNHYDNPCGGAYSSAAAILEIHKPSEGEADASCAACSSAGANPAGTAERPTCAAAAAAAAPTNQRSQTTYDIFF
jgi:hypothetical protein